MARLTMGAIGVKDPAYHAMQRRLAEGDKVVERGPKVSRDRAMLAASVAKQVFEEAKTVLYHPAAALGVACYMHWSDSAKAFETPNNAVIRRLQNLPWADLCVKGLGGARISHLVLDEILKRWPL